MVEGAIGAEHRLVAGRVFVCPTGHGRNFLFVALETDDGIVGYGEGSQSDQELAVVANINQLWVEHGGASAFDLIERLTARLTSGRSGRAMSIAISAMEQAVWDIIGKAVDRPVYQLLGGRAVDHVDAYATLAAGIDDWTPGGLAAVVGDVMSQGLCGVKIVPFREWSTGRPDLGGGVERVKAVREALGSSARLMIECNFVFDRAAAKRVSRELEPYDCYWLEAPLRWDDPEELATLRAEIGPMVASGEMTHGRQAYKGLFEHQALDVVQPDVKWTGGIFEAKKVASWAEVYQVRVAPHNNSGPVATAASAHLALTLPNRDVLETPAVRPSWEIDLTAGTVVVGEGKVEADVLAKRAGLGVSFDEGVARKIANQAGGTHVTLGDS